MNTDLTDLLVSSENLFVNCEIINFINAQSKLLVNRVTLLVNQGNLSVNRETVYNIFVNLVYCLCKCLFDPPGLRSEMFLFIII